MTEQLEATGREAVLVEDAAPIRMMGFPILEALPSPVGAVRAGRSVHPPPRRSAPAVGHEGRGHQASPPRVRQPLVRPRRVGQHGPQHRAGRSHGEGATDRGRTSGAQDGARCMARRGDRGGRARGGPSRHRVPERAVLGEPRPEGQAGGAERTGACNRSRSPCGRRATRRSGCWWARALPFVWGRPRSILDIELPTGGEVTTPVPPEFQGFAYVLEGEADFGANRRRARPAQLVLLGRGDELQGHRCLPRHPIPAHGGGAVRRGTGVQRAVRGLDPGLVPAGGDPMFGLDEAKAR